jgi:hypothetical protein
MRSPIQWTYVEVGSKSKVGAKTRSSRDRDANGILKWRSGVGSRNVAYSSWKVSRLESGPRLKVGADWRWCWAGGGITSWGSARVKVVQGSGVGFRVPGAQIGVRIVWI